MRIVVTGSRGVIGQSLVPRLWEAGHEVDEYDRLIHPQYNVEDGAFLQKYLVARRPDFVIHMAAQVGRLTSENEPQVGITSNIIGTLSVVNACRHLSDVKLINFSTSEVYGKNSVFGQPDILEQNGIYGLSKLAAEGVVKHYVGITELRACSLRPFMVYGPHERPNGPYRSAVSNFLDSAMHNREITAHEGCIRSWCYVDDFIDGLMFVMEKHEFGLHDYQAFSIGTDEYRSMEECAEIVVNTVGQGTYHTEPVPEKYVSAVKKADFSHIKELGFDPKVTLEEGVKRTYEWMVENL
jgi:dTDP-glucose 4,6-dehydratase